MVGFSDRVRNRVAGPIRGDVTEANTFAVTAVHAGSIADAAGVKAGMLYRPTKPAALSPLALPERGKTGDIKSRFVDFGANEEIEITTDGFPFGMELAKSPSALARDVVGNVFDIDALADLVHGGDRDGIGRFVAEVARVQSGKNRGLGDVVKGWFGKGGAAESGVDMDPNSYMGLTPHVKLVGAFWLAAHRNARGARLLLRAWEDWGVAGSGSAYLSLYHLARALVRETEGGAGSDIKAELIDAHGHAEESALVAAFWRERQNAPLPQRQTLEGQRFARRYRLAAFDPLEASGGAGANFVSLTEGLEQLSPEQRLLVIALGPYRANGFYSRILYRLQELQPVIGPFYPIVHAVTSYEAGNRHNPEWLVGEILARKRGMNISILHDPDGSVCRSLNVKRSPHAFIIDRDEIVRYDGFLPDEGGFWRGLAD